MFPALPHAPEMYRDCIVTKPDDLHAKDPIDSGASLQLGGIAVLQEDAGVALLSEHGWSSFAPRSETELTIKNVPLLVRVEGVRRPQRTDGSIYAAVSPRGVDVVALCLIDRFPGYDPDKDGIGPGEDNWLCRKLRLKWC